MGKRIAPQYVSPSPANSHPTARSIRKRKRAEPRNSGAHNKCPRLNGINVVGYDWHENDDEDSSSSGSVHNTPVSLLKTPQPRGNGPNLLNAVSTLHTSVGGHSDCSVSNTTESPRPVYSLRPSVVNGTILRDVLSKAWRLGRPIGKGNFGEIFLASDDTVCPVSSENAKYVVKIEPHSNGPLFVEIHCLINTTRTVEISDSNKINIKALPLNVSDTPPSGIPNYIASGTHYFRDARYRFLVLPRFDRDLHSLIKNTRVEQKSLLVLAIHIINVLEHLHDKGYCHNDIKAQNLMISKCKYFKKQSVRGNSDIKIYMDHYEEKQQTTDSGNSSEQETNDDDYFIKKEKYNLKNIVSDEEEDEDFDDGATTNSNNSNSMDIYRTPLNSKRKNRTTQAVQYSGSNPVRSCRREKRHSIYEDMVKSHYLRPTKRVSYSEFYNEDGLPLKSEENIAVSPKGSDNESEEFLPPSIRRPRTTSLKQSNSAATKRLTRRQDKLKLEINSNENGSRNKNKRSGAGLNTHDAVTSASTQYQFVAIEEEHIFLIDFGLASKYQDRGVHRPFIMDQRRAHDGTLEFTSRDAHLGAHSRRSDLECLGYNLLFWSEGYLPWKDVAQQQQQEKVHRAKELLMTDVREMLRQIYGKQVPKYLGEFLQQIGELAYQERPNYERYRNIFKREYQRLGFDLREMRLSSAEILRTCKSVKDEVDSGVGKCDIFELNNKLPTNAMRHSNLSTPFQEHSFTNRVSPKNLRSKSDKKTLKKKKFSWAEVLSQDPDQIARERAVKEFEREEVICPLQSRLPRRYDGKPTYAILAVEQRRRDKGLTVQEYDDDDENNKDEKDDSDGDDQENDETTSKNVSDESDSTSEYETVRRGRGRPRNKNRKDSPPQRSISGVKGPRPRCTQVTNNTNSSLIAKQFLTVTNNKRGCATRKELQALASATGEMEHKGYIHNSKEQPVSAESEPPRQRRTRRCLIKTDSIMGGQQDVENNSNFVSGLQLYDAWEKYDNENAYEKRRQFSSTRHCRK